MVRVSPQAYHTDAQHDYLAAALAAELATA